MSATTESDLIAYDQETDFHYRVKEVPVTITVEKKDAQGNVVGTDSYEQVEHVLDKDRPLVVDQVPGEYSDGPTQFRPATPEDKGHNATHEKNVVAFGGEEQ